MAWEARSEREKKLEELMAHYQAEREQLARDRERQIIYRELRMLFKPYVWIRGRQSLREAEGAKPLE